MRSEYHLAGVLRLLRPEKVELSVLGWPLRAEWSPEVDSLSLYLRWDKEDWKEGETGFSAKGSGLF